MARHKILAIKLRSLGDTVLMTAPVIELTHAFPESEIDLVVSEDWASLLEGIPKIHRIFGLQRHAGKLSQYLEISQLAMQIRKQKYDMVINFHASPSSANLAFFSAAKKRSIHFHGHEDQNRYSTVTIPGKGMLKPIIERDMDALRALGIHVPAGRTPRLYLQSHEIQESSIFLEKLGLKNPILALGLGASRPTKCWPIERFASLAIEWNKELKGSVLALAGSNEEDKIKIFLQQVDEYLSADTGTLEARSMIRENIAAINNLGLRALAAVLSQVSVFAGNDSGPRHVAVAVDTPTVTLFGPEDPFEWHPYARDRHPYLYIKNLECRDDGSPGMPPWCELHECVIEEQQCMRQIGVDSVLAHCARIAKHRNIAAGI